jgi:2-phosphoglycolate phosphatase
VSCVAFDLDGTLEDSRLDMVAAVDRVRRDLGLPPRPYDAVVAWVNKGMPQLYARCFDDFAGPAGEIETRYLRAYEEGICVETRLYPGIADAIEVIRRHATLAIVTNKPRKHTRLLLERLGLLGAMAVIVGQEDSPEPKPSPKALARAVDSFSDPHSVVMVGDSGGDVRMAQAYGAKSVWCAYGYYKRDDLGSTLPDRIAQDPSRLAGAVLALL